jgi:hypothetical protein
MPFSESAIYRQWIADSVGGTNGFTGSWGGPDDLVGDGDYMIALFGAAVTPDKTTTAALSAYGSAEWTGEITDPTGWPAEGRPLDGVTYTSAGDEITLDGADTAGAGVLTLAGVEGNLMYWTRGGPVANQGAAYHYYGAPQGVVAGTFTIVWNAAGIKLITV